MSCTDGHVLTALTDMCELGNGTGGALKDANGGDFGHTKEDLVAADMVHRRLASSALFVSLFCLFAVDRCNGCGRSIIQNLWGILMCFSVCGM